MVYINITWLIEVVERFCLINCLSHLFNYVGNLIEDLICFIVVLVNLYLICEITLVNIGSSK